MRRTNSLIKSERGSITAETAISIAFIIFAIFIAVNILLFAMQYQRLLSLAQESSRAAASMADPRLLENQISDFISSIDSDIAIDFQWETEQIKITLTEPTGGFVHLLHRHLSVDAKAPRWSSGWSPGLAN
jgi:Flp pilus assembly protein TadG